MNPWESENTAARLLSAGGYHPALSGKWHLGEGKASYPHLDGFDEY